MNPILTLLGCTFGLMSDPGSDVWGDTSADTFRDTSIGDTSATQEDTAGDCGVLAITWTPAVPSAHVTLSGELVTADGVQVSIWDERDTSSDTVSASFDTCGLLFRGIGEADDDGDGATDRWSSEIVSGDTCSGTGTLSCAWNSGAGVLTHERTQDGCSTWCSAP